MQRTIETRDIALPIDKIRKTEYNCERYSILNSAHERGRGLAQQNNVKDVMSSKFIYSDASANE